MPLNVPTQQDATCGTSLNLAGTTSAHCYWSFPYRSADARAHFDTMAMQVGLCEGPKSAGMAGNTVNHPDTYDQQSFEVAGKTIHVSLKDKAALQATMVFLRVEIRP